jgi:hypothetical protein
MQEFLRRCMGREPIKRIAHTHAFHTSHGVAHAAYFCAVMAESHGYYAIIGGVMVVYSFIIVLASDEE